MIIDSHMYCFPQVDLPQGYSTLDEKMRMLQSELGAHHQPVWRVRDRAPADNGVLKDPDSGELRDITWRRHNGGLAWEYEGELYTKQYYPPMLHNLECPPELMIAEMDYAGVDVGIMHVYSFLGGDVVLNPYLKDAVGKFPDRLIRLVKLTEGAIPLDPEGTVEWLRQEIADDKHVAIQFIPGFYYQPTGGVLKGYDEPWDDGPLAPFWRGVAELGVPVYFTLIGGRGDKTFQRSWQDEYLEEQRVLLRWMERYPHVPVVITHGLPWRAFMDDGRIVLPDAVWDVFEAPQCHMQLLIPIGMGNLWEYPWKEAEPAVRQCVERIGADRLMWGTDMPMVARFCTYRQSMDQFSVHCDFLSDAERADILGGTVARVMGIETPDGTP